MFYLSSPAAAGLRVGAGLRRKGVPCEVRMTIVGRVRQGRHAKGRAREIRRESREKEGREQEGMKPTGRGGNLFGLPEEGIPWEQVFRAPRIQPKKP